ncbi:MAG: hypothetical protein A3I26_03435 [Candidatus Yanofskybacteria bacterium RIFCSPLOWO2_02_FULL_43_10]|nr:MAG: hypothetical protein A2742_00815 [Candidatus Yanofskybacteria bacterium RIFCSPHIGHO2_01_FULL_43_32]OGN11302.1 MAG: hypothetical protein A3C69_00950 [Candidatus Yanofskybacteria bacterium RIFCSPHIGHO2_02_FULL_43_12]OGN17388.1 MAG: hypothetical protein A3E34_01005 [Candidatus Yanofskybacteria bacterium RIFCSPHIGHO2_12_FULL_43_11]OGN24302.1 MAG: hypothetical protein A2923_00055 [Candidatus Yanofskybacteria bacterium RIFCSPLOWO2_01_FULL_43_46]OGN30653.1 MAG: hypothetical protein A3I26_03435
MVGETRVIHHSRNADVDDGRFARIFAARSGRLRPAGYFPPVGAWRRCGFVVALFVNTTFRRGSAGNFVLPILRPRRSHTQRSMLTPSACPVLGIRTAPGHLVGHRWARKKPANHTT